MRLLSPWTFYNIGPAADTPAAQNVSTLNGASLQMPYAHPADQRSWESSWSPQITQPRRTPLSSRVQEGEERRWGLLDWGAYSQRWQVPWGGRETAGGMALWIAVFLATAFLLAPALYINLGSKVLLCTQSCRPC